ncbi:uncharacterized protein PV06_05382 [Exophiala oligosperma]|uniref:Uncharacterized protein n=2 Tax=Chaetothyriales TaxID=34395 RepID=A0A0D2DN91_9EURO|nr:uncharacterized protein PV06_05382 [Exophiala oligosperma]KAJ9622173.1 hypothetical protein H2204_011605 [Knufia peltigerae]KIW44368.1 hypothetical protein PV06_05382 [Exophiala oligosperma]
MVLLTSSAVSVALSSGVVCIFTFLLFMCGYVLQQQTVRSIQEALKRPPEPKPIATLPPQFQNSDNESTTRILEQPVNPDSSVLGNSGLHEDDENVVTVQVPVEVQEKDQLPLQDSSEMSSRSQQAPERPALERLAYMFILLEPQDLCSTLLFAKQQRESSRLSQEPSIVLIYPATWEAELSSAHMSALSFMREVQELYGLIYHPVRINNAWGTNAQLLGELQWHHWGYDQAIYLRSPGMVLNNEALDSALSTPVSRKIWAPVDTSTGNNPDILLVTPKGLQSPRRGMRNLVIPARPDQPNAQQSGAAYALFDHSNSGQMGHDNIWYDDMMRKFDQGRRNVCAGSGLL